MNAEYPSGARGQAVSFPQLLTSAAPMPISFSYPLSRHKPHPVCEVPIQLSCTRIKAPGQELPIVNPDHGRDLGEISGRKDLVRGDEIGITQRCFDHRAAVTAQKFDHALP